ISIELVFARPILKHVLSFLIFPIITYFIELQTFKSLNGFTIYQRLMVPRFNGSAFLAVSCFSSATCRWRLAAGKTEAFSIVKEQLFRARSE
ncbi:MAG: hypothetical protein PVH53_17805, partial [Desulfobacterales bacterium]